MRLGGERRGARGGDAHLDANSALVMSLPTLNRGHGCAIDSLQEDSEIAPFRIRGLCCTLLLWPVKANHPKAKLIGRGSSVRASNPSMETPVDLGVTSLHGVFQVQRLLFIAEKCPALQGAFRARARARPFRRARARGVALTMSRARALAPPRALGRAAEAYRKALEELRKGLNTALYQEVMAKTGGAPDAAWVASAEKAAFQQRERLEGAMNTYRTNLIKDSIRLGYNELGDFHVACGDLTQALRCYVRSRDYCSTAQHNAEMCLRVIAVAIDLGNFVYVNNYVVKAEHSADAADPLVLAKLRAAAGLGQLENNSARGRASSSRSRPTARRRAARRRAPDALAGGADARAPGGGGGGGGGSTRAARADRRPRTSRRTARCARELRARRAAPARRRVGVVQALDLAPRWRELVADYYGSLRRRSRRSTRSSPSSCSTRTCTRTSARSRARSATGASCSTACRTSRSS